MKPFFSIIIPVYNRPEEIDELLVSISAQEYDEPFEVCIVEDGSSEKSDLIIINIPQNCLFNILRQKIQVLDQVEIME